MTNGELIKLLQKHSEDKEVQIDMYIGRDDYNRDDWRDTTIITAVDCSNTKVYITSGA
jgi:hypothetical protein